MKSTGVQASSAFPIPGARFLVAAASLIAFPASPSAQSDPATLAERANRAMASRQFPEAAALYDELARSFPNEPSLQANLGMALHLARRDREAIPHLRQAASAMPSSFQAHLFLGAGLTRLEDFAEAVEPLRHAVRLNSKDPFAQALLADSLESTGGYAEARAVWMTLRELDRRNAFAHAGLVRCYEQLAALAFTDLKNRDPESPWVLRLLARARLAGEQYPSALYLFRQALARAPGERSLHEAVAQIYERTGRAEWARTERERLAALPETECSTVRTAACDFAAGRLESITEPTPHASAEDVFWAARAYAELAESSFADLAALPESPEKLELVSVILASQGEFSKAADAVRRALEVTPGDASQERQLAELLYLARQFDDARPLLERFAREDSRDPRWPAMLGSILADEQDFNKAVAHLEAAMALPNPPATARLDLGRSYLSAGKPQEAIEHLRGSLGMDTDGSVHYQLAQAYQQAGQTEAARDALAKYRTLAEASRQATAASASLEITPPN